MAVVATTAVVVAIVAIILGPPLLWIRARVVDESGFTSAVRELGETTEAREYLADTITKQIAAYAGKMTGVLARPLAVRFTNSEGFADDVADLAAQAHEWLFSPPPPGVDPEVMQLDLTAMVRRVAGQVTPGLAEKIPTIRVPVGQNRPALEAGRFRPLAERVSRWGTACVALAALASIVALAFSQHRGVVVAALGVGCLLSAGAASVAAAYLRKRATTELAVADPGMARLGGKAVGELLDNLHEWVGMLVRSGAILIAVGLLVAILF